MYPAYKAVAELEAEKQAAQSADWALQAEKGHADVYTRAKQAVDSGRDAAVTTIYVCEVRGHTAEALPEKCPVCGAKKESYRQF